MTADILCLLAAGIFFSTGLLTGVWKYGAMMASPTTTAPVYVDIAHRASLMYAFSAILLREFVPYSPLPPNGTWWAVAIPLGLFAAAIGSYVLHGVLRDTDNQFQRPHVLGRGHVHGGLVRALMVALIVGEIGGFAILFLGFIVRAAPF